MNNPDELRKHLFETIIALKDEENPMDIERARAVSDTAQTLINLAKVEVEHMKVTQSTEGWFKQIEDKPQSPPALTSVRKYVDGKLVTR